MGFSREQIVHEFAGIFERFAFDQRGGVALDQDEGEDLEHHPPPA
jgi:hypothetical protein